MEKDKRYFEIVKQEHIVVGKNRFSSLSDSESDSKRFPYVQPKRGEVRSYRPAGMFDVSSDNSWDDWILVPKKESITEGEHTNIDEYK